jgi:integrase
MWARTTSLYSPQGDRKYLTHHERERFIIAASLCPRREVGLLGLTLAYTGCRISEALALRPPSLLPELGIIAVRSLKKRGKLHVREIPTPPALFTLLAGHAAACDDRRLWSLSRSQAWRLLKELMDDAQIPPGIHATPKGLRHAYGLHAVRSGVPLNLLQRWLGHSSMKTTAIYADAMGREEQEIAARMWADPLPFAVAFGS